MAIRIEKGQRINLEKSNGSKLQNLCVGVNWGAIEKRNWLGVKSMRLAKQHATEIYRVRYQQ